MAKHKVLPEEAAPVAFGLLSGRRWVYVVAFALVIFYWTPLVAPNATIQWNAIDLHYPEQHFFAEQLKAGHLPHWANYIMAGFPLLSDPQSGGFYPLNWPFFLLGVTHLGIQFEIVLHALIAICGAFFLLRRLTDKTPASLVGALSYGLGGYFASHSSHVGMFQAAALLPWILYCYDRTTAGPRSWAWVARAAVVAGCCFLTGSLSSGVVALITLVLFAVWRRLDAVCLAVIAVGAVAVSAVVWVPALTLWSLARPLIFFQPLAAGTLFTLLWPNAMGIFAGTYRSSGDLTQTYLYSGLLTIPLVGFALRKKKELRVPAALLAGVPLLLALFHSADHFFAAALGLSILVTYGVIEVQQHWGHEWHGILLLSLFILDLSACNSWHNLLAYARVSYFELSGQGEMALRKAGGSFPGSFRLDIPPRFELFGSLNGPLLVRVESAGGYNPLALEAWRDYRTAALKNPRLVDGLSVALLVSTKDEKLVSNERALARAYFAPDVVAVGSIDETRGRLYSLNPARQALVQKPFAGVQQDPKAKAISVAVSDSGLKVKYTAASPSLMKVTNSYYPGWHASVDGKPLEVHRVDLALIGAVVPAGEHEVIFSFETEHFVLGAGASGLAAIALLLLALRREKR